MTKERSPQECPTCHKTFTPVRSIQKYCSAYCQRNRTVHEMMFTRNCDRCGQPFTTNVPKQHYCSQECHYGHDAEWEQAMAPRPCKWCHAVFSPSYPKQQFCSPVCAHGHGISHVKSSNSPENNERRRQYQLQRIAEGKHSFIKSGAQAGKTNDRGKSKRSHPPVPRSATHLPDIPSSLPPLPDIIQDVAEDETELQQELESSQLLSFPLLGEDARHEWMVTGDLREDQADRVLTSEASTTNNRSIILAGQGSYLGVEGYALVCHQGRTHGVPAPQKEILQPALHGVRQIIWLGSHGHQTGTMTLAATAWCQREGIHLLVLDASGKPLVEVFPESGNPTNEAEIQRRQWLVSSGVVLPGSLSASQIALEIVKRKVDQQYRTLLAHPELPGQASGMALFETWRSWLHLRQEYPLDYLIKLEGRLAALYFRTWEGLALHWSKPDIRRIPAHWLVARSRISPLSNNGRHAIDPVNCCLNYIYGCLASSCRQALIAEGLNPIAGFLHADKPGRDSLVYDLCELERGSADDLLLAFLNKVTLHYGDFARDPSGKLTVHPQLIRLLLAECRISQDRISAHAKWLKGLLFTSPRRDDAIAPAGN